MQQQAESDDLEPGASAVFRFFGIRRESLAFWEVLAIAAFAIGTITIMTYAAPFDPYYLMRSGTYFAIGAGAWMGGGTLGFLFGVPRYKAAADSSQLASFSASAQVAAAFSPNTNLEQISDWLTKIIVGATLVQLQPIARGFNEFCVVVGAEMKRPEASLFCGGITLFFFFSGFLWGYLWCSIRVFRELVLLTRPLQGRGKGGMETVVPQTTVQNDNGQKNGEPANLK